MKKLEKKDERRGKRVGSWEKEDGRKEKNDKLDNPKKSSKKWPQGRLLKNTFRHQGAYKMSPKTSPYKEF